jgi:hypothetical protein
MISHSAANRMNRSDVFIMHLRPVWGFNRKNRSFAKMFRPDEKITVVLGTRVSEE